MGAFIFSVYKAINQLQSYVENYDTFQNIETLSAIYKQIIDLAEVSFEGEPLEGLQIMGVLESRVLDFETVIITSVNEGKFPGGKNSTSFIPYDVKKEKGLPTYKEKDAIFTYHFYHLLHRAKKVYLLYNTDSEGLDAGEKSRFITQLEIEKQPKHTLEFKWYNPEVPEIAHQLMIIPKSQAVLDRLHEMALQGFSPSTLTTYIRNPIQFYFEKILRIKEKEDVEETIAVNTLGTIIHAVLEELYKPLCDKILILEDIHQCLQKVNEEVVRQFKKVYKEGEIHKGRNLLSFEVAKQSVVNFLNLEKEAIMRGDEIQIIALEKQLKRTFSHPNLPFAVELGGNVDRIERRNGRLRIIDYKTGKVEKKTVTLKSWDGFVKDSKNDKMIQLLAYAFLYEPFCDGLEIEAGIISFKNLKSGFLPFSLKENNNSIVISPEILEQFKDALATLFQELFDETIPFEEKIS
jgi:hypothetical protein